MYADGAVQQEREVSKKLPSRPVYLIRTCRHSFAVEPCGLDVL